MISQLRFRAIFVIAVTVVLAGCHGSEKVDPVAAAPPKTEVVPDPISTS